jgi:hypothetical protein
MKTAADGVTKAWGIANPATNHEIEGYASATSVPRGGSIDLFVNTVDPNYKIDVYRIGWYGGDANGGGRLMQPTVTKNRVPQPLCPKVLENPTDPASTYLLECNWNVSYTLNIPRNTTDPTDWASGMYLAKLVGSSGKQNYIVFVVRDDDRSSSILYQAPFTTYAAYDNWGQEPNVPISAVSGKSLYDFNSTNNPNTLKPQRAHSVSFNRPFAATYGTGEFLFREIRMLRFLEREGYDVTYQTNVDIHTGGPANLQRHKMFMMAGHDEYWTQEIRDNLEAARDAGVSLAFFGANTGYQRTRLEASSLDPTKLYRTVTAYKDVTLDPTTGRFRDAPANRPEAQLIGSMYQHDPVDWFMQIDLAICPAWLCNFTGTTVINNQLILPGLLGYEIDKIDASSPLGTIAIGKSPFCSTFDSTGKPYAALKWTVDGLPVTIAPGVTVPTSNESTVCNKPTSANYIDTANMTYYAAASGAEVLNIGSMFWVYGVDTYASIWPERINADAQQMTRNILNRFSATNPSLTALSMPAGVSVKTLAGPTESVSAATSGGGCTVSAKAGAYDISLLLLMFGGLAFRYRKQARRLFAQ